MHLEALSVFLFLRLPNFFLGNQASGGERREVLFPSQTNLVPRAFFFEGKALGTRLFPDPFSYKNIYVVAGAHGDGLLVVVKN